MSDNIAEIPWVPARRRDVATTFSCLLNLRTCAFDQVIDHLRRRVEGEALKQIEPQSGSFFHCVGQDFDRVS
jgi:hypothetical protein